MGVVDFNTYLNEAIQAGTAVEGNVVRLIADNGDEIGEAVFKVIEGGNGTASEVAIATQTGAGGVVATGLAYLGMEVGLVGVAIAPALGIAGGYGLYNLAPEFWDSVANTLMNAGKTIGGKVISYWNGENTYYDAEVIEIFKNAFLEAGIFEHANEINVEESPFNLESPVQTGSYFESIPYVNNGRPVIPYTIGTLAPHSGYQGSLYWQGIRISSGNISTLNKWKAACMKTNSPLVSHYGAIFASDTPLTDIGFTQVFWTDVQEASTSTALSKHQYTYDGKTVYFTNTDLMGSYGVNEKPYYEYNENNTSAYGLAWTMIYGSEYDTPQIQDGARVPDEDPFPLTYPTWTPYTYDPVLPDPSELPNVYPLQYPSIDPNTYPEQDPAQNPDPESVPEIYPRILPDFPLPNPGVPEPQPEPSPDPDPQPEPDPIPEDEPINPSPDPIDPNGNPDPSLPVVVPPLPNTVNSNKLFTVYNPSSSQLDALGGYLWDASIIAAIRDIWQDPMDGLISLQQVFVTPSTSGNHNIILGFLDSGVSAPVVSSQFVSVDCGSVQVMEDKKNATDYSPYTSLHLYLPFIGIVELDVNECMNGTISIKYKVDVYTGTCLAQVSIDRDIDMPNDPILYTFSGNCSQQLPLTSGNSVGLLSALIGAVGAGIKASSGGALSTLAGAQLLGNSLSHEMMHVSHSGNLSANAGIMGQKKPYLIIGRRHCYDANDYNSFYGYPANKTIVMGNHTGFVRVKKCWIKTTALQDEYNEIMKLLDEGVYL